MPRIVFALPVIAHLLPQLLPLIGRKVTPTPVRPGVSRRAEQTQQKGDKNQARFHDGQQRKQLDTRSLSIHPRRASVMSCKNMFPAMRQQLIDTI